MSPRRRRRRLDTRRYAGPGGLGDRSLERRESAPDGEWVVRPVAGAGSGKDYRCPGCDQLVRSSTPHLVSWPAEGPGGPEDRRHWHTACWPARARRAPRLLRGRGAPRY